MNEKKDDNLSEAFSKLIPILEANITQKDNSTSQNAVITDLSSPAEHSQSDTVTPCDSQVELNQTQACITHTVKVTDNGALTRLDSMEVSSTQPQGSPEPCLSLDEINSTQGITQLQSSLSSNPMESSCQKDSKPEKTDGCQTSDTITEQTESHDTPAIDAGPQIEVSTAIDSNGIDKMKQTTPEVENTVTNIAEVSEKSHLTVHSNSENQSSVAENAKSIVSAHQTSTANVISCSNLRDDTKVLLEQISAKNQSRSSLSKQTLAAPNEAKRLRLALQINCSQIIQEGPGPPRLHQKSGRCYYKRWSKCVKRGRSTVVLKYVVGFFSYEFNISENIDCLLHRFNV